MPQRPPQQTLAMECCVAGAFRILSLVKTLDTDVKVLIQLGWKSGDLNISI